MVILDTSIIIDHLRSQHPQKSILMKVVNKYPKVTLALSLISIQELYEGKSTLNQEKEKNLLATISPLKLLPYTYETAKLAGMIARDLPQPIELADVAIAATAILHQAQLCTLNLKDFNHIPDLEILSL